MTFKDKHDSNVVQRDVWYKKEKMLFWFFFIMIVFLFQVHFVMKSLFFFIFRFAGDGWLPLVQQNKKSPSCLFE
ncbi:hypothetical protein B1693_00915 [Geobacillus zalihae]|nr:hypothetical protein B1693_00915 [Geobacillus zalihae]